MKNIVKNGQNVLCISHLLNIHDKFYTQDRAYLTTV